MMKRIFALLLCAATLLTSLAFVSCGNNKDPNDKGQYITTYLTDNVYDLDPARAYANEALANVVSLMFEPLFKLDKNGKVTKNLVKEYKIEENKAAGEYTMKLYLKDTRWSDGVPVTANDIIFAWKRLLEVDANYEAAALLFDIKNARAAKEGDASIDDVGIYPAEQRMLEINFEGKIDYDHFLLNLTSLALAPLRDDIVSKSDDWAKKPGTIACSGPYKLSRINFKELDGDYMFDPSYVSIDADGFPIVGGEFPQQVVTDFVLERNMYYFRNMAKDPLDESVKPYRICVDCSLTNEQLTAMFDAGMMMYIGDIPLALRKDSTIAENAVISEKSMSTNSIYFNQNAMIADGTDEGAALFANEKVRQALSMAIDREAIAEAVVYADAATGLIPTGIFEAGNRKTTFRKACDAVYDSLKTDTTAAANLLDEAGITPSKYTFQLSVAAYDDVHCFIADKVVEAWTALGFNVTIKNLGTIVNNDYYRYTEDTPTDICDDLYAEELRAGTFEAILFDYVAYSADAYSMLAPFAKAFSGRGMDMSNPDEYLLTPHMTGYDSEEYNKLMEKIFAEKTIANRADLYREAEGILMTDLPIVPIIFNKTATASNKNLRGETTNYYGATNFKACTIKSYNNYLEIGKQYVTDNFSELKFTECNDCSYTEFEAFKSANTIYSQFFPAEKKDNKAAS